MTPTVLIPLGYHCNITYLTQQLGIKTETSLFEWLESKKLQYITDVINSIKVAIDPQIVQGTDNHLYLLNAHLYTFHYTIEAYRTIFKRRAMRFLEQIKTAKSLLFVRINPYVCEDTTAQEISDFCAAIRSINSNAAIKFLLISTVFRDESPEPLYPTDIPENIDFYHRVFYYEDCASDPYLKNNPLIAQTFINYLQDLGHNPAINNNHFKDND
jgi:hypothetical protein